jgi:predicted nucleic acid-binding protein
VIVVDTNLICYYWMPSPYSAAAEMAFAKDPDWIAPLLWRSDFRNALAGALRHNLLTVEAATEIVDQAERQFSQREFIVASRAVIALVARSRCSAYDCEFVALAQENRVPLVPVDRGLLRDFPETAVPLREFVQK